MFSTALLAMRNALIALAIQDYRRQWRTLEHRVGAVTERHRMLERSTEVDMAYSMDDTDRRAQARKAGLAMGDLTEMQQQLGVAEQAVNRLHRLLARAEPLLPSASPAQELPARSDKETPEADRLIPVVEWPQYHAWPKVSSLRHFIFHASHNGFESVIRRVGNRVLIRERAFFEWIDLHNGKSLQPELPAPTPRSLARKHGRTKP